LKGIGPIPVGTLVAEINGDYRVIGAGTHQFTAWGTGEIPFQYADIGKQDNFGAVTSTVMTPVPEPTSMALLLGGLGVVAMVARRRTVTSQ
jgi:hypothetical protein